MKIRFYISSILLITPAFLFAQKQGNDTLPNRTVIVTSAFKPTLKTTSKINFIAATQLPDSSKPVLRYDVPEQNLVFAYQSPALKPLAANIDSMVHWINKNYIKAGYGNFTTPYIAAGVPGFFDGACTIQDEGAQLAGAWLDVAGGGLRILDACAAPGNKTGHILEQSTTNTVLALDSDRRRLRTARDNVRRLGYVPLTLRYGDARTPHNWWDGEPFDRILLDAPCSATGTLRRHPDIKLLRDMADIPRLAAQQEELLTALWPCLATGGLLVYCTCSILPEENQAVIAAFLAAHADAVIDVPEVDYGHVVAGGRLLLPEAGGPDGFYLSRLRKLPAPAAPKED